MRLKRRALRFVEHFLCFLRSLLFDKRMPSSNVRGMNLLVSRQRTLVLSIQAIQLLQNRIESFLVFFQKFRYIAESEGRSANKEIEQYLKKRVAAYEDEFGKIEITNE